MPRAGAGSTRAGCRPGSRDETWRPLPRREFSVRKDYDVLVGTNRHTITPQGWVQEENNLKLALNSKKFLAREYGVARYERIRDYDFSAGETYYTRTEPFWAEVRAAWRELEEARGRFAMRAPVDQGQLFMPFFEYADKLAERRGLRARGGARVHPPHAAGPVPEMNILARPVFAWS